VASLIPSAVLLALFAPTARQYQIASTRVTHACRKDTKYFKVAFPSGSEILDVGAGSGRDLGILIREQYEAYGAEPSPNLRALALGTPGLEGRICEGALPNMSIQIGRKFDGVLCSAVFQHIPRCPIFKPPIVLRVAGDGGVGMDAHGLLMTF
jgi:SAM-dependent methyltransferase